MLTLVGLHPWLDRAAAGQQQRRRAQQQCEWPMCAAPHGLLPHQRSNLVQILIFFTWVVAPMDVANIALAIHDDRAGHTSDLVKLTDLAFRVEQYRKSDRRGLQESGGVA